VQRSGLPEGTVLAQIPSGEAVDHAVKRFERDPRIAWAEPNVYRYGGSIPNDPFFGEQWALQNTGQTVDGVAGAAGADIQAGAGVGAHHRLHRCEGCGAGRRHQLRPT
jgi:hypothetical protein